MITFEHRGDFKNLDKFLSKMAKDDLYTILDKWGQVGCYQLALYTPSDTGKTAASWYYTIEKNRGSFSIYWSNSNVNDGVKIAVILQMGHGTDTGGYVRGTDYINPALVPIFENIATEVWREVTSA